MTQRLQLSNQPITHTLRTLYHSATFPRHATRIGLEPRRKVHNGLAVHRLNHSATSSTPSYARKHSLYKYEIYKISFIRESLFCLTLSYARNLPIYTYETHKIAVIMESLVYLRFISIVLSLNRSTINFLALKVTYTISNTTNRVFY